jgi:hypothetical protein
MSSIYHEARTGFLYQQQEQAEDQLSLSTAISTARIAAVPLQTSPNQVWVGDVASDVAIHVTYVCNYLWAG